MSSGSLEHLCEMGLCRWHVENVAALLAHYQSPFSTYFPQHVSEVGPVGTEHACFLSFFPALPFSHIFQSQPSNLDFSCQTSG